VKSSWPNTGRPKTPEWELEAFKKAAWRDGFACIRVDSLPDDWFKQAVINWANERYGRRG
jgi:hypothetical protein